MALAVTVILLQFLSWISFGIDGFAYAAESLVGKYFGAKNWQKFEQAIRYSFFWGFVLASFYALLYYFGGEWLLGIYTDKTDLIEATKPYLVWTLVMGFAGVAAFVWDGVFIGMTASRAMRNSVMISLVIFVGVFYFIKQYHSLHLYWFSFVLFLFLRGIIQSWMFYKHGKKLI
jgi:MATE family multidrug resistance protein